MRERYAGLPLPSEQALAQIEEVAYRLLAEVGIALQHAGATEMLAGLGCRVAGGRVYIPPEVTRQAERAIAPLREFRTLDGQRSRPIGAGTALFHNSGGIPFVLDGATGQRRPALTRDLAEATRLLDALPNVDAVTNLFGPQDAPAGLLPVWAAATVMRNTRKPFFAGAESAAEVRAIIRMAGACCGGAEAFRRQPTVAFGISPVSPLTFPEKTTEAILEAARLGAPLMPLPAPSLGATSPITLAAAVAQQHAELLACMVLAGAARAGVPMLYCSRISATDLRTATSSWGGPEVGLAGAWATGLAHRIGLPCDTYGLCTSSAGLDPQAAFEKLNNSWPPLLAGADVLSGVGSLGSLLAGSYEAATIDDEMIALLRHIERGYGVSDETLAFDVMREVIEGNDVFLGHSQTVRQMRRGAMWTPKVSDWSAGGEGGGIVARARARAGDLLRSHEITPWPDDVERELTEIVEEAGVRGKGHYVERDN